MARPADFNIDDFIDALRGTADTIDDHLPAGMEYVDLTSDDFQQIDLEIFQCDTCGWWYEVSDQSDNSDSECKDCAGDEDE